MAIIDINNTFKIAEYYLNIYIFRIQTPVPIKGFSIGTCICSHKIDINISIACPFPYFLFPPFQIIADVHKHDFFKFLPNRYMRFIIRIHSRTQKDFLYFRTFLHNITPTCTYPWRQESSLLKSLEYYFPFDNVNGHLAYHKQSGCIIIGLSL